MGTVGSSRCDLLACLGRQRGPGSHGHVSAPSKTGVALAIGLIIGIERGWKQRSEPEGERAAGLRTHALAGLLGGIWGALTLNAGLWGPVGLGLAFAAFTGVIATFRYREMLHEGSFGATTVVAGMIAFALGALAVLGDPKVAAAAAGRRDDAAGAQVRVACLARAADLGGASLGSHPAGDDPDPAAAAPGSRAQRRGFRSTRARCG